VVYNHFGPEGNYLRAYAPEFFTDRHCTPWGEAINFDGRGSRAVRDYFINNALYWLSEYHFDGLRFDAVHAIADDLKPDILTEIAETVRREIPDRHVHLVLENDKNVSRYLSRPGQPRLYDAQWNDDIHHALHVIVTGEKDGYYSDYADCPVRHLGRCLAEGFDFQGQPSPYRDGERRGDPSRGLPPSDFVSFLQNHDQIGNRAFGDRILKIADPQAVRAAMAILLLSPQPPLLFMGEELGADTPFLFFCDFGPELAKAVTEGRRSEFARFEKFRDPAVRERIPDPNAESTFLASKLDWASVSDPPHQQWLNFYGDLLRLRRERIVPLVGEIVAENVVSEVISDRVLRVYWPARNGRGLTLIANLGSQPGATPNFAADQVLYTTAAPDGGQIPGWSVTWLLEA
jgi:malto-oligosyltrehalose trehalohydrolase